MNLVLFVAPQPRYSVTFLNGYKRLQDFFPTVHSQTVGKRWTSWLCSCVLCNHQQEATLVIIRYLYKNLLEKQPFSTFPDGFITSDHSFTSY